MKVHRTFGTPWLAVFAALVLPHIVGGVEGETLGQHRIRAHLEGVEAVLRQRDASALSPSLQRERLRNLDRLHQYRVDGVFPQNPESRERKPFFIDADGRACAMAHLIIESGAAAAAQTVSQRENNAYVREMQSPELGVWLAQSGLSIDEAAWIQPAYGFCDFCSCEVEPVCGDDGAAYPNLCYATRCAGVGVAHEGCCAGGIVFSPISLFDSFRCPVTTLLTLISICSVPQTPIPTPTPTPEPGLSAGPCWGDCNGDTAVTVDELLLGVRILLGEATEQDCPAMSCHSECGPGPIRLPTVSIGCLIKAVNRALDGCPSRECRENADCNDNNGCSADLCTADGCTHECLCL